MTCPPVTSSPASCASGLMTRHRKRSRPQGVGAHVCTQQRGLDHIVAVMKPQLRIAQLKSSSSFLTIADACKHTTPRCMHHHAPERARTCARFWWWLDSPHDEGGCGGGGRCWPGGGRCRGGGAPGAPFPRLCTFCCYGRGRHRICRGQAQESVVQLSGWCTHASTPLCTVLYQQAVCLRGDIELAVEGLDDLGQGV